MKATVLHLIIGTLALLLWSGTGTWAQETPTLSSGYVFEQGEQGQMHNLYYTIAAKQEQEMENIAIKNITQTLRSYGPADSGYITEELVRRIIANGSPSDMAIILAEMRRKEEYAATSTATQEAMGRLNPEQGQVFEAIRQTELELQKQAASDQAQLEPERQYNANAGQQTWHELIESGDVLRLFTSEDIIQVTQLFENLYAQERDLATLEVELAAENTYSTIFENGTLNDSFYDLIDDLNGLDKIWYGEKAQEFSAPWQEPKGLPADYQDPRQQSGAASRLNPGTIRISGSKGNVFVPVTNKTQSRISESVKSRESAASASPFYDARLENRSFMPFFAEQNLTTAIPSNHEQICIADGILCIKIDINVLSYPLLGSSDYSLFQQLTELRAELGDMSQKNLTIKTAGKNVFEIGLTPGTDLSKMLDMNVITASKPTSFPTEEISVEDRAKNLEERIAKDLKDCMNTTLSSANNLQGGTTNPGLTADKVITSERERVETCQTVLDKQALLEHQELKNEGHERTFTQLQVMAQLFKNFSYELGEIHHQTVTIEAKPRK